MGIFENTILVEKKVSMGNLIARYLCIAVILFCLIISFTVLPGILIIPAVLFGVLWYVLKNASQLEFEYTYIEGRLTFARIKAKRKRKNLAKVEMEEVILIAPSTAHELYNYHNNRDTEVRNYSSRKADAKTYEIIYKNGTGIGDIIFEPDDAMLEKMRVRYSKIVNM